MRKENTNERTDVQVLKAKRIYTNVSLNRGQVLKVEKFYAKLDGEVFVCSAPRMTIVHNLMRNGRVDEIFW